MKPRSDDPQIVAFRKSIDQYCQYKKRLEQVTLFRLMNKLTITLQCANSIVRLS